MPLACMTCMGTSGSGVGTGISGLLRGIAGGRPAGPSQAAYRVIRGGCWFDDPRPSGRRTAQGHAGRPGRLLGFRVARVQSGG